MIYYWLSTTQMTCLVGVDKNGIVRETPPILYKFLGQTIENLRAWMSKQPGFHEVAVR